MNVRNNLVDFFISSLGADFSVLFHLPKPEKKKMNLPREKERKSVREKRIALNTLIMFLLWSVDISWNSADAIKGKRVDANVSGSCLRALIKQ